jgi:hypothetical protein
MARISIDNGNSYIDHNEVAELREAIDYVGWDVIVEVMDDDVRERCHMESDATDEPEWLADYLRMADEDLVIG